MNKEGPNLDSDLRYRNISSLIIKVTNRCNLKCEYCYENVSLTGLDMKLDTFKQVLTKVTENTISRSILVIFHGGEPLLIDIDWYKEAVDFCNKLAISYKKNFRFGMQSNATNLQINKATFLVKNLNIRLGLSFDGPLEIINKSLRGRDQTTLYKLQELKKNNIPFSLLLTINASNYNYFKKIMHYLHTELNIFQFKANLVYPVGHGYNLKELSTEQINEAYSDIMDYMMESKGLIVETNMLLEMQRFVNLNNEQNKISLCDDRVCGAGKRVFGVSSEGNILPCGRFEWNDKDSHIADIFTNYDQRKLAEYKEKINEFHNKNEENWLNCNSCEAKKVCRYGCQAFITRTKSKVNLECLPTKFKFTLYKKYENELNQIINNHKK
jgi:uncharacterized protein